LWYNPAVPAPRFLLAAAVSAVVILSSPFIRDVRDLIRAAFPGKYAVIVGAAVAIAIGLAILAALVRIRDRRALRYGAIALALILGATYAAWNAQGIAEVDAVERVHFVEYGLIAFLFYRAWRPRGDFSMFVLPMLAGIAVGTLEEWLQWFIPGRVGDMRDVFLNCVALVCGLLFSAGIDPPDGGAVSLRPGSLRRIGWATAAVGLLFAAFVYSVHVGREIRDDETGRFRTRYTAEDLARLSEDRQALWKVHPPLDRPRSRSREDQYMSEALLHALERNRKWETGDMRAAWAENRILEKYYAPVLDAPSYIDRNGHRWPDAQRNDARQRLGDAMATVPAYESRADATEGRHFIRVWSPLWFWAFVVAGLGVVLGLCAGLARMLERRSR
jgi:hypothetical protein